VCADIFDIMLAFVYTNEVPRLGQRHLSSASILQLFDAADLHLLLAMKVPYCIFRQNSWQLDRIPAQQCTLPASSTRARAQKT